MQRMLKRAGVKTYEGDLCCYDLTQVVKGEELHIKKPTRFMTNSPCVGEALSEKCRGQHRHIELTGGGRARRAEVYPDKLCRAILEGLRAQLISDGTMKLNAIATQAPEEEHELDPVMSLEGRGDIWGEYFDVNGNALESNLVRAARAEEIEAFHQNKPPVYTKVPIQECYDATGKAPIGTRWME